MASFEQIDKFENEKPKGGARRPAEPLLSELRLAGDGSPHPGRLAGDGSPTAVLARQYGAFGIVTYDPLPDPTALEAYTRTTDDFRITSFPMKANGTPDFDNLVFNTPQSDWNVSGATPKLKGASMPEGPWTEVPSGGDSSMKFFKVVVEVP